MDTLNLSGIYVGTNSINKIYLGDNIVYGDQYDHLTLVYNTTNQPFNMTVAIPTFGTSPNGTIDWGNGFKSSFNSAQFQTYSYPTSGIYTVKISGSLSALNYTLSSNTQQNKPKLIQCLSFGELGTTNFTNAFANCRNLNTIPNTLPTGSTSMNYMFYDTTLNDSKIINYWQSGSMTTMNGIFGYNPNFNQNISVWNTSNVTSTYELFRSATAFNQNISSWNMSSNTNMGYMFAGATSFNQNISNWNVSGVTSMISMFDGATSFNQNLSGWNIAGLSSSAGLNNFMRSVNLNSSNYNGLLSYWNNNKSSYRSDLSPNFGSSKYTITASGARQALIDYGWILTDGGITS